MRKLSSLSGKVKKNPSSLADPNRYDFLDLQNAEPDLGVPAANNYVLASDTQGNRTWFDTSVLQGPKGDPGEAFINADGGDPNTNYGGIDPIDGGSV